MVPSPITLCPSPLSRSGAASPTVPTPVSVQLPQEQGAAPPSTTPLTTAASPASPAHLPPSQPATHPGHLAAGDSAVSFMAKMPCPVTLPLVQQGHGADNV
jgi:hypothetical protein